MVPLRVSKPLLLSLLVFSLSIVVLGQSTADSSSSSRTGFGPSSPRESPTLFLSITPADIKAGEKATLSWSSTNATSVSIDTVGQVGPSGTVDIVPLQSITYKASAVGAGGTAQGAASINVAATTAPTIVLTATPNLIGPVGTSTLQWSSANATSVKFSPVLTTDPDAPPIGLSGSYPVAPGVTTTYAATATGSSGTAVAKVTVTVNPKLPFVALVVSPSNIIIGQSARLTWVGINLTSLTIDNGVGAQSSLAGGVISVSPTTTTTYTVTGVGPLGTVTASSTVNVPPPNQLAVALKANPPSIATGSSTTLKWVSQAASSLSINGSSVGPSGSMTVSPKTNTSYTLTAKDASGNVQTATANIAVVPSGDPNQIRHIIVWVQENRSFDNYFGMLGNYRITKGLSGTLDGIPTGWAMPDKVGAVTPAYHFSTVCHENLPPSWNQVHSDLDATCMTSKCIGTAKMDHFLIKAQATTNDPEGHRAIGYYDQLELPYYYELAAQFATSDRWFSPLLGPTVPNRMYIFTGTSFGHIHSDPPPTGGFTQPTIFQRLREAGVSWRYYYQDNSIFLAQFSDWPVDQGNVYPLSTFATHVKNESALPEVLFIERASSLNLDEHPNNNIQKGAATVATVINTLMNSPSWGSSAFILTYDEAGGLADHVPPAVMPPPDNIAPIKIKGDAPSDFSLSGFRVPLIVVSPWVKPNYVSHVVRDSTAILKFIETRFGVPPLTARDAIQDDMYEFFDFSTPSRLNFKPTQLPVQPTTGVCKYNQELVAGP